jgi:hypothetical protein
MPQTPAYYRARLKAFADKIKSETDEKRIRLLQNGYFPEWKPETSNFKPETSNFKPETSNPLTFLEQCRWDTWFAMHPEKVCGKTVITTSRSFPLTVNATKDDVIKTVTAGIEIAQQTRIRITKAKLKLLKLNL